MTKRTEQMHANKINKTSVGRYLGCDCYMVTTERLLDTFHEATGNIIITVWKKKCCRLNASLLYNIESSVIENIIILTV